VPAREVLASGPAKLGSSGIPGVGGSARTHMGNWLSLPQLEGVVAKRADRPYASGRRTGDWVKVKRHRTVDCAVVGVAGDIGAPKLVLALRHADEQLLT
jgi:ATP-dependent DNA ligase